MLPLAIMLHRACIG